MGEKTSSPIKIVDSQWGNLLTTSQGTTIEEKKLEAAIIMKKVYPGIAEIYRDARGNITIGGAGATRLEIAAYEILEKEGLLLPVGT